MPGLWETFGCSPDDPTSHTGADVMLPEAKEAFIDHYLNLGAGAEIADGHRFPGRDPL